MKHFKHLIIYLSILSLIIVIMFSRQPLKVYAEIPSTQKAVAHTGTWGGYAFDYSLLGKYFTIEDATGIPTSTVLNAQYFYTDDNETFYALKGKELYTAILNRGIGMVVTTPYLNTLYNSFMTIVGSQTDTTGGIAHLQGALYDSNNVFLGYCVNDISGCYYYQPQPADTPAVDVPDELTDDVYNHYKYYTADLYPDYITVYPFSKDYTLNHYGDTTQIGVNQTQLDFQKNLIDNLLTSNQNLYNFQYTAKKVDDNNWYIKYNSIVCKMNNLHYIYYSANNNYTNWNNFCEFFNLKKDGDNSLLYSDLVGSEDKTTTNKYITVRNYDSNGNYQLTLPKVSLADGEESTYSLEGFDLGWYHASSYYIFRGLGGEPYTVYKNADIYNSINNKTYSPNGIPSSTYINYNPNNDNSFTISYNTIDNSTTNNAIIYNDSHDEFQDNTDNSVVNNNEIHNVTQNIIYIYYPDGNPGPDPWPDPDEPSDDDDDINNDNVLSALLTALRHFFHVIGQLLGTILTGIVDILNSILTAIAGIMEDLTGLTSFISALFGWIPSPVPEVLAIGISITILFALIKFIRG